MFEKSVSPEPVKLPLRCSTTTSLGWALRAASYRDCTFASELDPMVRSNRPWPFMIGPVWGSLARGG